MDLIDMIYNGFLETDHKKSIEFDIAYDSLTKNCNDIAKKDYIYNLLADIVSAESRNAFKKGFYANSLTFSFTDDIAIFKLTMTKRSRSNETSEVHFEFRRDKNAYARAKYQKYHSAYKRKWS